MLTLVGLLVVVGGESKDVQQLSQLPILRDVDVD